MEIEKYAEHLHFYDEPIPTLLMGLLDTPDWKSYLNLGCGDGALLVTLHRQGKITNKKVFAVDLSQTRIERVRSMLPEIEALVASADEVPALPDGSIDLLVSTQVIEHVPDDLRMLKEMARLSAPGSKAYLSTVFKKWYGWYFYRCNGKWALDPTHVREYGSEQELIPAIEAAGFRVLKQHRELFRYPLLDFVLRRMKASNRVYEQPFLKYLRTLKTPILGYYNWEFVLERKA